jgi:alpha-galactosidase
VVRVLTDANGGPIAWVLDAGATSYVMALFKGRYLVHYHWGGAMEPGLDGLAAFSAPPEGFGATEELSDRGYSLHRIPQEFPWPQGGDFRSPAVIAEVLPGGAPALDFAYRGFRIGHGVPDWGGLPLPHADPGETTPPVHLEIELEDRVTGLAAVLFYLPLPGAGVIVRACRLENRGAASIQLRRALSFSVDLPCEAAGLDLVASDGGWARERTPQRRRLGPGKAELGSRKGVSGHGSSPNAILASPDTSEDHGEAWAAALMYSGDWSIAVERSEDGGFRFQGGLHTELFSWRLGPGEAFHCPAAVLAHSSEGFAGLSRLLHAFTLRNVMPAGWAGRTRPVLLNSWEATYFDYREEDLLAIARGAAALGAELFVLDDGWFGRRDDATTSLGDWTPDPRKLPGGLAPLAEAVHGLGLGFGLWIEPESVSRESDYYRTHPDQVLALEGREAAEGRNQLLLDLARPEVLEEVRSRIASLLRSARIDYVKWDMNRPYSRAGSPAFPAGEARHRSVLGFYALARALTADFPGILFEGCSGGGGRLDYGVLSFFPQVWLSDNTDPTWRAPMEDHASLFFPAIALCAHLSASPNHQTGRVTGLAARSRVAMAGVFGLELDPRRLPPDEAKAVAADIAWYKANRGTLQLGQHSRLCAAAVDGSGRDGDWARLAVSADGRRAIILWMRPRTIPVPAPVRLRLPGLDPDLTYALSSPDLPAFGSRAYTGRELVARGFEFEIPQGAEPAALAFEIQATG